MLLKIWYLERFFKFWQEIFISPNIDICMLPMAEKFHIDYTPLKTNNEKNQDSL